MLLSDEYVFRAVELRVKTTPIVGTLCKIEDPRLIWNAMKYFQCYNWGQYVSHPFVELDIHIFENMTLDVFQIYIELLHHWTPPCTEDEIRSTMYLAKKFGYDVTEYQSRMSIRRVKHESPRSGDCPYTTH